MSVCHQCPGGIISINAKFALSPVCENTDAAELSNVDERTGDGVPRRTNNYIEGCHNAPKAAVIQL